MALNPALHAHDARASLLAFDKSTVVVWTAISLLLVETFSGALRYYFDLAGLGPVLYLPKMACTALFVIELFTFKGGRGFWLCLLALLISGLLGMLHGASVQNLAFSLFAISPLLFALVCSRYLLQRQTLLGKAVALCLLASLLGLLLDKYAQVPWKGYSYSMGDTQLSGNTAWSDADQDRVAGFARVSSVLANLIALYSLYLLLFVRALPLRALLCAATVVAVVMTTSKAPAAALVLTLGMLLVLRLPWICRALCVLVVAVGLLLPLLGLMHDFDAHIVSSSSRSLASLYDRLNNTWPNLVEYMMLEGWGLTGAGFGMVGSTQALYPVMGAGLLAIVDSTPVYLWAMLGVAGLWLYVMQVPLLFALIGDNSRPARMLLSIAFFCCLVSWTSDLFEIAVVDLFLGLVIGHVLGNRSAHEAKERTQPFKLLPFTPQP